MIKKIVFLALVLFVQCFAQRQKFRDGIEKPDFTDSFFYAEIHSVYRDSTNKIFFVYRIPYSRLVFTKNDGKYLASFRLALEVTDTASNHITRQIVEEKFFVNDFDETLDKNNFYQNTANFKLSGGRYNILPFLTDLNTNVQIKLHPLLIDTHKLINEDFYLPIIVNHTKMKCHSDSVFVLTNYDDGYPFDDSTNEIIIPCSDTSVKKINVVIKNNTDTVYNSTVSDYFASGLSINTCNGQVVILSGSNHVLNNFVITNLPAFSEGEISIFVKANGNKTYELFSKKVVWFDKPLSLRNPETAIRLLKFIEPDSVISKLLRVNSDDYKKSLYNYWEKYHPSVRDTYNPLMNEYYSRIDYAAKNFVLISGKSGIETDRSKIYIQFGPPQKIERTSNHYGKVVETWIYNKPEREFVFIDDNGTGNFKLK